MTASAPDKKPVIVCITPVKNEAHNLRRFLACASLWADYIIVADQYSDDDSAAIIQACPKAQLIRNESKVYNEEQRQILLLNAARQIPGPRVIFALDADEVLPSQLFQTSAWDKIIFAPPGTVGQLQFINLFPDMKRAVKSHWQNRVYVDDDHPHTGHHIHSSPVPIRENSPTIRLPESMLLHYAMVDSNRFDRRQIWYQCFETLNTSNLTPIQIYRRYHELDVHPPELTIDIDPAWFGAYNRAGIKVWEIEPGPTRQWDRDIFQWMLDPNIGPRRFSKIPIWNLNWNKEYEKFAGKNHPWI